jgi:hypothetical protein
VGWLREDLPHSMDIDLFLRLDKWGTGLEYHPQVLGSFRWHTLSQTVRTPGATETEANTTREAHLPSWVIPPLRRGLRYAGRQLALLYYRWQQLLDGLKVCQS